MPRYFCTLHKNITTNDFDLKPLFEDDNLYSLTQNRRYQKVLRTLYNVSCIIFLTYSDILTIDFLTIQKEFQRKYSRKEFGRKNQDKGY